MEKFPEKKEDEEKEQIDQTGGDGHSKHDTARTDAEAETSSQSTEDLTSQQKLVHKKSEKEKGPSIRSGSLSGGPVEETDKRSFENLLEHRQEDEASPSGSEQGLNLVERTLKHVSIPVESAHSDLMDPVPSDVTDPVSRVKSDVTDPVSSVKSDVTDPVSSVKSDVTDPVSSVKSEAADLVSSVKSDVTDLVSSVKSGVTHPVPSVKSGVTHPVPSVKDLTDLVTSVKSDLTGLISSVKSDLTDLVTSVKSDVKDSVSDPQNVTAYSVPSPESDGTFPASSKDSDEEQFPVLCESLQRTKYPKIQLTGTQMAQILREVRPRGNRSERAQNTLPQHGERKRQVKRMKTIYQQNTEQQQQTKRKDDTNTVEVLDSEKQSEEEGMHSAEAAGKSSEKRSQEKGMHSTEAAGTSSRGTKRTKPQLTAAQMAPALETEPKSEEAQRRTSPRKRSRKEK